MSPGREPAFRLLDRAAELGAITAAVGSVVSRPGSALLVEGVAGIGKTSLLACACERAARAGMTVRVARAAEFEGGYAWRLTQAIQRPPPPDPLEPLSPREREVLELIARGHSNRHIARDLVIGEQTVKTHVRSILAKLGMQDRVQAAIFALRHHADGNERQP